MALMSIWLLDVAAQLLSLRQATPSLAGWVLFVGSAATLVMSPEVREATRHLSFPHVQRGAIVGEYVDAIAFFVNVLAFTAIALAFEASLLRWREPIVHLAGTSLAFYLFHRPLMQMFTYLTPIPARSVARRLIVFVGIPLAVALLTPSTERLKRVMKGRMLPLFRHLRVDPQPTAG